MSYVFIKRSANIMMILGVVMLFYGLSGFLTVSVRSDAPDSYLWGLFIKRRVFPILSLAIIAIGALFYKINEDRLEEKNQLLYEINKLQHQVEKLSKEKTST